MNMAAARYAEVARLALKAFELLHDSIEENDQINELVRDERVGEGIPEWVNYWRRADANLADPGRRRDIANPIKRALEEESETLGEIEKVINQLQRYWL